MIFARVEHGSCAVNATIAVVAVQSTHEDAFSDIVVASAAAEVAAIHFTGKSRILYRPAGGREGIILGWRIGGYVSGQNDGYRTKGLARTEAGVWLPCPTRVPFGNPRSGNILDVDEDVAVRFFQDARITGQLEHDLVNGTAHGEIS
jgi:hypothetical protein